MPESGNRPFRIYAVPTRLTITKQRARHTSMAKVVDRMDDRDVAPLCFLDDPGRNQRVDVVDVHEVGPLAFQHVTHSPSLITTGDRIEDGPCLVERRSVLDVIVVCVERDDIDASRPEFTTLELNHLVLTRGKSGSVVVVHVEHSHSAARTCWVAVSPSLGSPVDDALVPPPTSERPSPKPTRWPASGDTKPYSP